ncbi:aminomethyltransferase [Powellomyces hirtus]|uniref:Aminomethyltransferase n=1 Tax=Powellomyces hirtus TaxID=109895 RepID=A0A507DYS9_9FUNG|nr:aminomethyltransferase [Powellomyces hirtus]
MFLSQQAKLFLPRRWPCTQLHRPNARQFSSASLPSTISGADYLRVSNGKDQFSALPGRGFLEIEGPEAVKFLQGLTTNQISRIERGGDGIFAAFLTAQGRVLYDVFIYPKNRCETFPHPCFVVEHDSRLTQDLMTHLKRYKLRAKLNITNVSSQFQAYQIWGPNTSRLWGSYLPPMAGAAAKEVGVEPSLPSSFSKANPESYTLRRILLGIPEGADDFSTGTSLPLESNLDLINGVDFRKGCYLGQELTIRTYHTGVTRKRIVPVQFYTKEDTCAHPLPSPQTDVTLDQQQQQETSNAAKPGRSRRPPSSVGKICSGLHNVGLALMRLDYFGTGDHAGPALLANNGLLVRPFAPQWWPQPPEAEGGPAADAQ